jgi:hypothetical protein
MKKRILSCLLAACFLFVLGGCESRSSVNSTTSTSTVATSTTTVPTTATTTIPQYQDNGTVAGVDADNDGVRDDVQQYIASVRPNEARKREALMQYARTLQTAYTKVTTEAEAVNVESQIQKAVSCIVFMNEVTGKNNPARAINNLMHNTPERLKAQLKYEKFLDGKVFTVSSPGETATDVCDFDLNSLPN